MEYSATMGRLDLGLVLGLECSPDGGTRGHQFLHQSFARGGLKRGIGAAPQAAAHHEIAAVGRGGMRRRRRLKHLVQSLLDRSVQRLTWSWLAPEQDRS